MTRLYADILTAYRHDSNVIAAKYDPEIETIEDEIGALTARRNELVTARDAAQAQIDARLAEECHIKVDADGCCVARQGKPRKVAEPALVSPTPDPILANLANSGLAAAGVPIDGYTPDGVPFGPGAAGGGVVLVGTERPTSPVSVAPTAAEEFIADVSDPERSLLEQGFTLDEIAATPADERWRLKRGNVNRDDVIRSENGIWYEPATKRPDPIENEEAPF